jgi:hypothetical protein
MIIDRLSEKSTSVCGSLKDNCIVWNGSRDENGYGKIMQDRKSWSVHRISWLYHHGPIPEGKEVCHRCDRRACWNPDHLFVATHDENMKDAANKGRAKGPKGIEHWSSKLNEKSVKLIRNLYRRGNGRILAKRFGVTDGNIYMVAHRRSWKHV